MQIVPKGESEIASRSSAVPSMSPPSSNMSSKKRWNASVSTKSSSSPLSSMTDVDDENSADADARRAPCVTADTRVEPIPLDVFFNIGAVSAPSSAMGETPIGATLDGRAQPRAETATGKRVGLRYSETFGSCS